MEINCYLCIAYMGHRKFGLSFICEIACVAPSLFLLPVEVSVQVIKILRPQLDDDEAGCIFQSLGRLVKSA